MNLALHRRTFARVRRVLMLVIAPLLLAGLVVLPGTAPAAVAANAGVDISAGGPAAAPFVADEDFAGGATAATTNAITTTGVTNPAPQSVYQHNRYGNFTYTIPGLTAGASYNVRLDFAEEYWTTAGSRTFNVLINGTQVLTNFDIFATAGGEFKAVAESFTADGEQRRRGHHPVRHRQGQRPDQRHRDLARGRHRRHRHGHQPR